MSKQLNSKRVVSIYWEHSKRYKKKLWIIYPSMVLAQVVEDFIQPLIISYILTSLATGNLDQLKNNNLVLILLALALTEAFGLFMWNRLIIPLFWRTQEKIMRDLSMTSFDHLQLMSARFFGDRFAGSLVSQVNKFVNSFERLSDALTWNVFKLIVSLVATTIILFPKAPQISIAILVISTIYIPLVWKFRKKQLPINQAWAAADSERTGQLADAISNIMAVKSFAGEKAEHKRMQSKVDAVFDRSMDTLRMNTRHEGITGSVQRSINVSVIVLSVLLAINGNIDIGVIYLALTFGIAIMRRLWDLNMTFRTVTRVFGDAHDMAEILDTKPEIVDIDNPQELEIKDAHIDFKDVTFAHEKDAEPLFKKLSMHIDNGEKIGLVGHSGGGKTTITKLLMRFMDIQNGAISIDDQNIANVKQTDLRRHIAYVPQEPILFHRTLSENIAYGQPNATQEQIEHVAKLAHAHEFIKDLPLGYKTLVGERGVKLSGGQRQRIVIARAMIKDAHILVLDEATSALDSESEVLIQKALWTLMEGKTAIVIAHRLSTIQKMDRIIVLSEGKIIEEGSHTQLLAKKGAYANLWKHQSGGFIED
ncbi:MAG: ABC transporter ATP-binding protein [Candidatus Saccharibacteria bacterium]|nr:ABC transporter ATP-binding protein [Candidatus Saccharibacteria bacterium]